MSQKMQTSDRVSRGMKLKNLKVLMTVVEVGGMGKAAERLNSSQPVISRAIAELERAFGVRLLDRHARGVAPTEFGRALLDCGIAVFDDLEQGIKNIESLLNPDSGEVSIGCNPVLAASFAPAVIDRMLRLRPRVTFRVVTGINETLKEELYARRVDLLITRRFRPEVREGLIFERIYDDSYVVAAAPKHRLAARRKLVLADLVRESWALAPPEAVIGAAALDAFLKSGVQFPPATVVSVSPEVRFALVATGRYLTILPTSFQRFSARTELKILPVDLRLDREQIGIVRLKGRTLTPLVKLFMECAREIALGP